MRQSQIASNNICCLIAVLLRMKAVVVKCFLFFSFYLMPEKLEFEEWMILVMAFNLLNTNKQKAAQSRACNQFAIRPGL